MIWDLQKEYGNTPEKAEDAPLDELGTAMQKPSMDSSASNLALSLPA